MKKLILKNASRDQQKYEKIASTQRVNLFNLTLLIICLTESLLPRIYYL